MHSKVRGRARRRRSTLITFQRGTFFLGLFNLMHLFLFVCLLAAIPAVRSVKQYFENEEVEKGDSPESHTFFKNLSDKVCVYLMR